MAVVNILLVIMVYRTFVDVTILLSEPNNQHCPKMSVAIFFSKEKNIIQ